LRSKSGFVKFSTEQLLKAEELMYNDLNEAAFLGLREVSSKKKMEGA